MERLKPRAVAAVLNFALVIVLNLLSPLITLYRYVFTKIEKKVDTAPKDEPPSIRSRSAERYVLSITASFNP